MASIHTLYRHHNVHNQEETSELQSSFSNDL